MQANPKNSKKNKKQQHYQQPLIDRDRLSELISVSQSEWMNQTGTGYRRRWSPSQSNPNRTRWMMNKDDYWRSACKQVWCMRFWFLRRHDGGGMAHGLLGQPALVRGANLLISQRWLMGRRIRVLLFFTTCLLACFDVCVCVCALLLLAHDGLLDQNKIKSFKYSLQISIQ